MDLHAYVGVLIVDTLSVGHDDTTQLVKGYWRGWFVVPISASHLTTYDFCGVGVGSTMVEVI